MSWSTKKLSIFLVALIPLLLVVLGPSQPASAVHLFSPVCNNGKVQGGNQQDSPVCKDSASAQGDNANKNVVLRDIQAAANIIASLAGVAAVIIIIISGLSFVTAGGAAPGQRSGDPNKIKSARSRIVNASIGLVIIALAWTITRFVLDKIL